MNKHHELRAGPDTVHWGYFDATIPPVLRIESGDRVTLSNVSGGPAMLPKDPRFEILPEHHAVHARHSGDVGPHIMTGPIFVAGAEPGDVLEVRIETIKPRQNWAYNVIRPLWGTIPEDFGDTYRVVHIDIDVEAGTASPPWGGTLRLAPFFGNMGVAPPAAWGRQTSTVPRDFGGNIDLKELVAGTTLYLPVFVPGALFSAGDGHGLQGDGEVCVSAIEMALEGTFELIVRKDLRFRQPRAETATHFITMGFDVDLDTAAKCATRDMIALIGEKTGLCREDAYSLMSLACDLRVTQMVNINRGVHAMIAKDVLHPLKRPTP
jgi:acetamidase/formamidase